MAAPKRLVFVSYERTDRKTAQQLAEALRAESLDVWIDVESIAAGENWQRQAADALDRSEAMVVLLTARSVESEWVRREVEYALSSKRFERRLVPVVIGSERAPWLDKAPWVLQHLNMVVSPTIPKAARQVAEALRKAG